jgi:hypothetical protein
MPEGRLGRTKWYDGTAQRNLLRQERNALRCSAADAAECVALFPPYARVIMT